MAVEVAQSPVLKKSASCGPAGTDRVALIDSKGNIVAVNSNWLDLAEQTGAVSKRVGLGVNYLDVCRRSSGSINDARKAMSGIRAVLNGDVQSFTMDYSIHLPSKEMRYRMTATPFYFGDARLAITHTDITDLQLSQEKTSRRMQQFARRLMRAQEEERERISREIHDDLGSRIASLSFLVHHIMSHPDKRSAARKHELGEVIDGISEVSKALRDLSHCLHPPLLRHAGICCALKRLCEEFGKMRDLEIEVKVPAEAPRIPEDVGLCIFRISQECLQNIAKHSGANRASLILDCMATEVQLRITDEGRGFALSETIQKGGLGLTSMEERVLCLKGHLEVNSAVGIGTEVRVTIPIGDAELGCRVLRDT